MRHWLSAQPAMGRFGPGLRQTARRSVSPPPDPGHQGFPLASVVGGGKVPGIRPSALDGGPCRGRGRRVEGRGLYLRLRLHPRGQAEA
eukprot:9178179-Lingulodinium_polyedra.AAC.1